MKKTQVSLLLVALLSLTALPLRASDAAPTTVQVALIMKKIELDVALKQFEKVENALADARTELALISISTGTEAQKAEQSNALKAKLELLSQLKLQLRNEIEERSAETEKLGKLSDSAGTASRH